MKSVSFLAFLLAQDGLSSAAASTVEEGVVMVGAPFVSITGDRGGVDMQECTKVLTSGLDPFEEARNFAFDCVQQELAKATSDGDNYYELAESQRENFQVNAAAIETARRALATTNVADDDASAEDRRLNPCYGPCLDPNRCIFCCCTVGCTNVCYGCQNAGCNRRRGLGQRSEFEIAMNAAAAPEEAEESDDDGVVLAAVSQTCAKKLVDHINEEIKINGNNNCFGTTLKYEDVTIHINVLQEETIDASESANDDTIEEEGSGQRELFSCCDACKYGFPACWDHCGGYGGPYC